MPPGCLATADEVGPHSTSAAINIAHEVYVSTETFGDITKIAKEETCTRDFQTDDTINIFAYEFLFEKSKGAAFVLIFWPRFGLYSLHVHVRCCD